MTFGANVMSFSPSPVDLMIEQTVNSDVIDHYQWQIQKITIGGWGEGGSTV